MQALALRYEERLYERLAVVDNPALIKLSLPDFVDLMIDITEQHFRETPGYSAIYMEMQRTIPELQAVADSADAKLIQDLGTFFAQRNPGLEANDYEMISFVLVKAIGNLSWLSLYQEQPMQQRLIAEMKSFSLSYLRDRLLERQKNP